MPGMNLTKAEAVARAAQLRDVAYAISWDFTGPGDAFRTVTEVRFAAAVGAATFLDCAASRVTRVVLNGAALDLAAVVTEGRIELTGLAATNTVLIEAEFAYHVDGQGIHRFVDPETHETYLYSQFAATDARAAFPCFDQPDIRATFAIDVTAPAHWVVVSNSPTPEPEQVAAPAGASADAQGALAAPAKRWSFAPTDPLPTYVAAVVAGPYASAGGTLTSRKGEIPARVYGRATLADHLDADEMLAFAQAGLKLYERVFGIDYPFAKYDQVFVPEYNLGAMENVGCVTFSEDRLLFRSRPSEAMRQQRANIVLHELSHMWFGNLVTMQWWDDLWLNESFAEFMGTWATERTTAWTDAWVTFGASRKSVAYVQDQLPTTHPIVAEIPDVEATVSAFDMITYAKGASALKQLVAFVGEDAFFAGVHAYLTAHAFGNATLADFLGALEAASGQDLKRWATVWLETPGPSTLSPVLDVSDGAVVSLAIAQDVPAAFPVHRPHRVRVAGHAIGADGVLAPAWVLDATVDGALTAVPDATGLVAPDLLLVNHEDLTYAKTTLDPVSLATVAERIDAVRDRMVLAIVLDSLWHMCRDGALPAERYIDAVLASMPAMTNSETVESHVRSLALAIARYVPPARVAAVTASVADRLWAVATGAAHGSDLQLQALRAFARFAANGAHAAKLGDLLDDVRTLPGVTIDTDLAWELLSGMLATGAAGEGAIAPYLAKDPGAVGQRRAAGARAAIGTPDAKRAAWEALARPGSPVPNAVQYEIAAGLIRAVDPALLAPLAETILADLRSYYDANEGWVGARVAKAVFPVWAAGRVPGWEARVEAWLAANADAPSVLVKVVAEGLDDVRRALAAQAVTTD